MDELKSDRLLHINQSFRFGPKVANVANALLGGLKDEKNKVIGAGYDTELRWDGRVPTDLPSLTIISRTNGGLFEHAVTALRQGKSLSFVGGVLSYGFSKLCDVRLIANGRREEVKDSFLRSFTSLWQLQDYAEQAEDLELLRLLRVTEDHGDAIFELVEQIHARARADLDAQVVLTTAHKSKGLTRDHVHLADDFPDLIEDGDLVEDLDPQEVNLAYVALTRAVRTLSLNSQIIEYLRWRREQSRPASQVI